VTSLHQIDDLRAEDNRYRDSVALLRVRLYRRGIRIQQATDFRAQQAARTERRAHAGSTRHRSQPPRNCPSPSVAAYYDTACCAVSPDHENPFSWPQVPYAWGQRAYWALEMRPDLWNNRSDEDPNANDWTAYTWPQHAALEGLTVDHAPAAGAVIVWPQSADNDTGHVGYVKSVGIAPATGDDLVTLEEMNDTTFDDPSQGQGDTMTLSMDAGDLARVQVIHGPGSTSGTVPTTPAPAPTSTSSTQAAPPPARTSGSPSRAATPPARTSPGRATQASAPTGAAGHRNRPRLSVHHGSHGLRVSSRSPAALRAAIFELPSGKLLDSSRLRPGGSVTLPAGRFRLCVSQAAIHGWSSARACVTEGRPASTQVRVRPRP
jgi:surface antigen